MSMTDKLDAGEQRQLLSELQALRSMLEGALPASGTTVIEPPLLDDIVTGEVPAAATGSLLDSATHVADPGPQGPDNHGQPSDPAAPAHAAQPAVAADAADEAHAGEAADSAAPAIVEEDALELQFGLDDPDWTQFVDQVFAEHQDLAADHNGPGRPAGASKRDLEQSRDAALLAELTRNLDARLAKLRQTLLLEIKDMLQRRGRLR